MSDYNTSGWLQYVGYVKYPLLRGTQLPEEEKDSSATYRKSSVKHSNLRPSSLSTENDFYDFST